MPLCGEVLVRWQDGNWIVADSIIGYDPPAAHPRTELEAVDSVVNILNDSVALLRPIAPRVATLLSGGVDSSILATVARDRIFACDTFSSSYSVDDPEHNFEQKYALSAAAALSTRHTLFTPNTTDFLVGLIEALANAEMPLHHLQSILLHLLFKRGIPKEFNTVLIGEGADSAFGMYKHFKSARLLDLRSSILTFGPVCMSLEMLGRGWTRARNLAESAARVRNVRLPVSDPLNPLWDLSAYGDFTWTRAHYGASREDVTASRRAHLDGLESRPFNDVLSLFALNFRDVVSTTAIWSKLAEGQGKIAYFPFVTKELLDTAFSISWDVKLKTQKHVLRAAARELGVPSFILDRPKQAFGIVSNRWAEQGGLLEPLIAVAAKVVDIKQLRSLQGTEPRKAMTLWSLLNYAVLKRLFVMGESKQALQYEVADHYNGVSKLLAYQ